MSKKDLEKEKKLKALMKRAADAGKIGATFAVSDETKNKIKEKIVGGVSGTASEKKQKWTTDKSGTTMRSNDGYIAPTQKGIRKNKEDEEKGITIHYNDPVYSKGKLTRKK